MVHGSKKRNRGRKGLFELKRRAIDELVCETIEEDSRTFRVRGRQFTSQMRRTKVGRGPRRRPRPFFELLETEVGERAERETRRKFNFSIVSKKFLFDRWPVSCEISATHFSVSLFLLLSPQAFVVGLAFCYFACLFLAFFILYLIFES